VEDQTERLAKERFVPGHRYPAIAAYWTGFGKLAPEEQESKNYLMFIILWNESTADWHVSISITRQQQSGIAAHVIGPWA